MKKYLLGFLNLLFASLLFAQPGTPPGGYGPGTGNSTGGGGLTQVSSLPATCTPSTTAPVQLTVASAGLPIGIYVCTGTNTWTIDSSVGPGPKYGSVVITPAQLVNTYGAQFQGTVVPDITTTNLSTTVSAPDAHFQTGRFPAVVGMFFEAIFGTGGAGCQNGQGVVLFGGASVTTIASIVNDTTITVVGTANTSVPGTGCAAWGYDVTAAILAAQTAGGCSAYIQMPAGVAFFQSNPIPTISACPSLTNTALAYPGQGISGQGTAAQTILIPRADFAYTGGSFPCSGLSGSSISCFGNPNVYEQTSFEIWGLGKPAPSALPNTWLIQSGIASRLFYMNYIGWDWSGGGTSLTGIAFNSVTGTMDTGGCNYVGSVCIEAEAGVTQFKWSNNFFSGANFATNSTNTVKLLTGSNGVSTSNVIAGTLQLNAATLIEDNDNVQCSSGSSGVLLGAGSTLYLRNNNQVCASNPNPAHGILTSGTGNTLYIGSGNAIGAGGAGQFSLDWAANNSIFEQGSGNSYTAAGGATAGWNGLGSFFGDGNATGTALAAANITPTSGFGTGCATAGQCISAVTGATKLGQFTVTYGTTPSSPQVITIVFPKAFTPGVVPICRLTDVGGTNAFPTSIITTTCTATGASFTITNTPVGGSTDILQIQAGNP
jgi:hypothetical protein